MGLYIEIPEPDFDWDKEPEKRRAYVTSRFSFMVNGALMNIRFHRLKNNEDLAKEWSYFYWQMIERKISLKAAGKNYSRLCELEQPLSESDLVLLKECQTEVEKFL